MAEVDPDDDQRTRYVVWHYRYDPLRRQRRNVIVAAYDDRDEFEDRVQELSRSLRDRKAAGEAEPGENIGGDVRTPGHAERAQNTRLLQRAIGHGVWTPHWDRDSPPDGVHIVSVGVDPSDSGNN
ncbi:hypothetical protein [Nocardioides aurantiacus]|uniref:hypothetical protein n=1 Tax=Nocardioides aurantiacus TaxID=86796 RepID=UPI0011CDDDE2|nr:hypothetical protein [Nocardioides aurantiacus]